MAKDFGADYSINPLKEDLDAFINKLTDGEGVNAIFEAAGVPALLAHATSQPSPQAVWWLRPLARSRSP